MEIEVTVNSSYVRHDEIKILYGSSALLDSTIGAYRNYQIEDTFALDAAGIGMEVNILRDYKLQAQEESIPKKMRLMAYTVSLRRLISHARNAKSPVAVSSICSQLH